MMQKIVSPLLEWYSASKRILPWRKNTDPYRIWISEIMLQQTRVEAVKEYYVRFLGRFPHISALAEAEEDEVLKYWEGLGYYSRARNLHKAAKLICAEYGGKFPSDYDAIRSLPGIGEYTAGAISSIAFELPVPAVDGNVLRVLTRLTSDERCIDEPAVKKDLTQKLAAIYPAERRGDFTQSLMELGATVCLPNGAPKCGECPLKDLCQGYRTDTALSYPVRKEKAPRKIEEKTVLLMEWDGKTALRKRTEEGLLKGLWELPNFSGTLTEEALCEMFSPRSISLHSRKKHIFTHIEWHMTCWRMILPAPLPEYEWVTEHQLKEDYALPAAFSKYI